jgi:hypothetical protein
MAAEVGRDWQRVTHLNDRNPLGSDSCCVLPKPFEKCADLKRAPCSKDLHLIEAWRMSHGMPISLRH